MLSDDATITPNCNTEENFTWMFDYVKTNAEQLRTRFKTESYNIRIVKSSADGHNFAYNGE